MENFDLVIIGGGPGGYEAAVDAAKQYGMKVALVENRELGGTCLNRGCIPTKTMLYSASLFSEIKSHGNEIGLTNIDDDGFDMEKIQYRKEAVVAQLRAGIESLMKINKVTVCCDTGVIRDKNHVHVTSIDGKVTELETRYIMIATGSVPSVPPILGARLAGVVTSDRMLDQNKPLDSLIIIGGGVIGMEFASVFNSLGTKVTIIEALDRIIANMDKEICQSLKMLSKKKGIDIHTNAMVTEIKGEVGSMTVCYNEKDEPCEISGQLVLLAIGRRAYTEGLFDRETSDEVRDMKISNGKITVNGRYETTVPGIYAIGDVIGGIQLAHVATGEGRSAVAYMNNSHPSVDMTTVPSCIYTSPEIASVGISSDDAKKQELDVITRKYTMGSNGKSILSLQERGFIKVIADSDTHKILGAQMMCARATDMISQFSQAIISGLTLEEMAKTIYPHPSFSEGIGEALK